MPPVGSRQQRRLAAVAAALDLLEEFEVDQTQQIDVFGLCERVGLWLAFVPLDNVLGAFLPDGAGGVMITTQRPLTVQRYTAGHELGHWRMDHGPIADEHAEVFGANNAEREHLAQIFAGALLMPPPLVFSILDWARSAPDAPLTPRECYLVAREAGVSYEAALWQLVNLEVLTRTQANSLFQTRPLSIKTDLAYGRRPVNGWADVWPVDEAWDDEILHLRIEDEAVISLPENRSTGYRWVLADAPEQVVAYAPPPPAFNDPDASAPPEEGLEQAHAAFIRRIAESDAAAAPGPVMRRIRRRTPSSDVGHDERRPESGVDVVGDDYLTSRVRSVRPQEARQVRLAVAEGNRGSGASEHEEVVAGTTGRRLLGIRFGVPGMHTVRLAYRSPYAEGPPLDSYSIHAIVETRRARISVDQIVAGDEDDAWVQGVRARQATEIPPALDPDVPGLAD